MKLRCINADLSFDKLRVGEIYESETIAPGNGGKVPDYVAIRGLWWELSRFEVLNEKEGTE